MFLKSLGNLEIFFYQIKKKKKIAKIKYYLNIKPIKPINHCEVKLKFHPFRYYLNATKLKFLKITKSLKILNDKKVIPSKHVTHLAL